MNIMCIVPQSHVSADGFDIRIEDDLSDNIIFSQSYIYGYTASFNINFANDDKPFVTDIIVHLVNNYNVSKIYVTAGKFVFSGKTMSSEDTNRFIRKYIKTNSFIYKLLQD